YDILAGVGRDPDKTAFLTPCTGEAGELVPGQSWINDLRCCGPPFVIVGSTSETKTYGDAAEAAAAALAEHDLGNATIGVEMNHIPVGLFQRLKDHLPRAKFIDGENVLWHMRMIKSATEIERIRLASKATEAGIDQAYRSLKPGTSELELDQILRAEIARHGAHREWNHVAFGPKGARNLRPTENRIEANQVARLDVGGNYQGYVCDMSRVAVLGEPSDNLRRIHQAVLAAHGAVREAMKPGARGKDLHRIATQILDENELQSVGPVVGHGVGLDLHEPPYLSASCETHLEVGMVLTVEIALRIDGLGSINVEDMVLLTPGGHELITTSSPTLRVIE
ncbi:MAG: Xaa-Pro peptidase family protein, partial [Pirellulaceae bacterium]|nr:Xaa-Pro peptidase family protein [Pirellulaceae bacterium]